MSLPHTNALFNSLVQILSNDPQKKKDRSSEIKIDFQRLPELVAAFDSPNHATIDAAVRNFGCLISNVLPHVTYKDLNASNARQMDLLVDLDIIPKLITICDQRRSESTFNSALSYLIVVIEGLPLGPRIAVKAGAIPFFINLLHSPPVTAVYQFHLLKSYTGLAVSCAVTGIKSLIGANEPIITSELIFYKPIPHILRIFTQEIKNSKNKSIVGLFSTEKKSPDPFENAIFSDLILVLSKFLKMDPYTPEIIDIITVLCSFITVMGSDRFQRRNGNVERVVTELYNLANLEDHQPFSRSRLKILTFLSENAIVPIISLHPYSAPACLGFLLALLTNFPSNLVVNTLITTSFIPELCNLLNDTEENIRTRSLEIIQHCFWIDDILLSKQLLSSNSLRQLTAACLQKVQKLSFITIGLQILHNIASGVVGLLDFDDDAITTIFSVQQIYLLVVRIIKEDNPKLAATCLDIARYLVVMKEWQLGSNSSQTTITSSSQAVSPNPSESQPTNTPQNNKNLLLSRGKAAPNLNLDFGSLLAPTLNTLYDRMNKTTEVSSEEDKVLHTKVFYGVLDLLISDLGFCYRCDGDMLYLERPADHRDSQPGRGPVKVSLLCKLSQDLSEVGNT